MSRIHRGLIRKAKKVDPDTVADQAEDYLYGARMNKSAMKGVAGLVSSDRIKKSIKKIDDFEREMIKLENKIETLLERRAIEAARLDEHIANNLDICYDYLEIEDYNNFFS